MARFEDGCYGSLKGIALIAKVLAGRCKMHYTRVAVGRGAIPEGLNPKVMDEPPDYVMDAMISDVSNPVDGECQVSVQISSADVETGFYVTSLLLYAMDPDVGEVPYTYLLLENEPEWIRPASSIVGKLATFDIIAAVGDVDTVSAAIDPNALVTYQKMTKVIDDLKRQLFAGEITMQLATRDGAELATRSGDLLLARRRLFTPEDAAQQAETLRTETCQLVEATAAALTAQTTAKLSAHDASAASHAVLTARTDTKLREHDASGTAHQPLTAQTDAKFSAHNRQVFAGEITEPLATRDGSVLTTRDGTPIIARRRMFTPEDADQLRTETRQLVDTSAETLTARIDAKISTHNASADAHPALAAKLGEQTDAKISTHNASSTSHPALIEQADTKLDSHNASAAAHSALATALATQMDSKISAHDASEESHPTHLAIRTITNEEDDNNGSQNE